MPKILRVIVSLWLVTASTFTLADLMDSSLVPKQEAAFARDYLHRIQSKDFAFVKSQIDPSVAGQITDQKLMEIANYFPTGNLLSTELIGSQVHESGSRWQGNFTFEYHFDQGWALANVTLNRSNDKLLVVGFQVTKTKASQKEINKFTLSGKSNLQYLMLTLVVLVPLFVLTTLIACIRTPMPRRKWLWVLFILMGIGTISVNWTTGEYAFKLIQFQLFGVAAYAASQYAPWVLTAGLPIGAIAFWFRRMNRGPKPHQDAEEPAHGGSSL